MSLQYSASTISEAIYPTSTTWAGWNDYFGNTNPSNCAITTCTLLYSTTLLETIYPVSMQTGVYTSCINDDSTTNIYDNSCTDVYDANP